MLDSLAPLRRVLATLAVPANREQVRLAVRRELKLYEVLDVEFEPRLHELAHSGAAGPVESGGCATDSHVRGGSDMC